MAKAWTASWEKSAGELRRKVMTILGGCTSHARSTWRGQKLRLVRITFQPGPRGSTPGPTTVLSGAASCSFKIDEGLNLLGRRARGIEFVVQPFSDQLAGELHPDHPLADAQDLGIVRQDGTLDRIGIVCGHGTDALDLVRGHRDAEAGAADQ